MPAAPWDTLKLSRQLRERAHFDQDQAEGLEAFHEQIAPKTDLQYAVKDLQNEMNLLEQRLTIKMGTEAVAADDHPRAGCHRSQEHFHGKFGDELVTHLTKARLQGWQNSLVFKGPIATPFEGARTPQTASCRWSRKLRGATQPWVCFALCEVFHTRKSSVNSCAGKPSSTVGILKNAANLE